MAYIIPTSIIETKSQTIWTSLPHIIPCCLLVASITVKDLTDHSHAMIIACNLLHLNEIPSLPNLPNTPRPLPELFILCNLCDRFCTFQLVHVGLV